MVSNRLVMESLKTRSEESVSCHAWKKGANIRQYSDEGWNIWSYIFLSPKLVGLKFKWICGPTFKWLTTPRWKLVSQVVLWHSTASQFAVETYVHVDFWTDISFSSNVFIPLNNMLSVLRHWFASLTDNYHYTVNKSTTIEIMQLDVGIHMQMGSAIDITGLCDLDASGYLERRTTSNNQVTRSN